MRSTRVLVWLAVAAHLAAYNPPVDTAGPLTASIAGPDTVLQTGVAVPISVKLDNAGPAALNGIVRLRVVDAWSASPASAPFQVAAGRSAMLNFTVTAGEGTYNAHYPVHAFAEFTSAGFTQTAHPVLIVQTKLASVPVASPPVPWAPQPVAPDAGLAVWRSKVERAIVQVFGKDPRVTAVGWQGTDAATRMVLQFGLRVRRGDTREALSMHPPWYQGQAGTAVVEFPLELPATRPIQLQFANAIQDTNPGDRPSDGVTFRVRALPFDAPAGRLGDILFERNTASMVWVNGAADLSAYAGQRVRLQLESDPGPKRDTTDDLSYWAEPTLTAGQPPAPPAFPPPEDGAWRALGALPDCQVRVRPGPRGLLDGAVALGSLYFQGFRVQVLGDALHDWRSVTEFLGARDESSRDRYRLRHLFRNWAGTFDLIGELWVDNGSLMAHFALENAPPRQPWLAVYLEDVSAGPWSAGAARVYAGVGNVVEQPAAFTLGFDGHHLATSFVGFDFPNGLSLVQAVDAPPTQLEVNPSSRLYTLHAAHEQTLVFTPARAVWDAVKTWRQGNGLKAAGGVRKLAGRFVFDLWGGRYAESAVQLARAFRYGLTDAAVVWHNWQRWGYDYRLPDIWPPNPQQGTQDEFVALAGACRTAGVLFAPHDNYIDFYPDAEGFSYDHISFNASGAPIAAWYNESRDAQSYRWRPDRLRPFAARNLSLELGVVGPTAYFIDVWSSMGPHDYWTRDGQFYDRLSTRGIWGGIFADIREFLGESAPQISESGHDQLIGWLDGAQTNHLRVDPASSWGWNVTAADAERIPWIDAAHHDRFALHGAGYESRYAGGLDTRLHGMHSDDYMVTEVLDGHPGMAQEAFSRDAVRKYWLLHDLMRALALERIEGFEFDGGNLHRQHITWSNGAEIWVNRGAADWTVGGHVLPQYGFYARAPGEGAIEAAIERRDGVIVDWSVSPGAQFVNARPATSSSRAITRRRFPRGSGAAWSSPPEHPPFRRARPPARVGICAWASICPAAARACCRRGKTTGRAASCWAACAGPGATWSLRPTRRRPIRSCRA
jgi:hypothetical protein